MIKLASLKRQVEKSLHEGRTSPSPRRLFFQMVDAVARSLYGDAYPTKCFQYSAVHRLLDDFRIRSQLMAGAVCIAQVLAGRMPH